MSKTYSAGRFDSIVDGSITEIESNATSIGQYALNGCTSLTSVSFPKATSVDSNAFQGCTSLTSIQLPKASYIGSNAFLQCTGLHTVDCGTAVNIAGNAFAQTFASQHIILRGSTLSTINNNRRNGSFADCPVNTGNGAVYVPSDMVNTYKTASGWSNYINEIHAISEYPITDFSTITDDWATILSNPNYATDYSIGDTKLITIDGSQVYMQIAAFDTDVLASDTTQTAKITWISMQVTSIRRRMHSAASTSGGWYECELRGWLRDTAFQTLPEVVRNNIKEVNKTYYDYDSGSTLTCADTLWIPSTRELNGTATAVEDSGVIYSTLFPNDASRVKGTMGGRIWDYWLRTAASSTIYRHVPLASGKADGEYYTANYASSTGPYVVIGFCT